MALTPHVRSSSALLRSVALTDPDVQISQGAVRSVINYPTYAVRGSQTLVRTVSEAQVDIQISQAFVRAIVRGRTYNPKVRVWTFTLDRHDYIVFRLGETETLIYDTFSKQWYVWGSGVSDLWRVYTGCVWPGGRTLAGDNANVVAGDHGNGALYFLDPDGDYDDDAVVGSEIPRPFTREVTAQYIITDGYSSVPCNGLQAYGSVGQAAGDVTVELRTSDDRGISFRTRGSRLVQEGAYSARLNWTSLGGMQVPGRLFKIIDTGALRRLDQIDMDDPNG